jgi:hypothetical protein
MIILNPIKPKQVVENAFALPPKAFARTINQGLLKRKTLTFYLCVKKYFNRLESQTCLATRF